MQSTEQTAKFEPEEVVDPPARPQNGNILGLPNELLLRVASLLSANSARNLMVNRSLRPVCEQALYQSISLPRHPRRSLRLLETFLLRPDLALLVRHLEIDLSWRYPGLFPPSEVPSVLLPDGLEALRLIKNIQSLSLDGAWIWKPEMAKVREAIFNLKLVRLEVPLIADPHIEYECVLYDESDGEEEGRWNGEPDSWEGDLGNEICKLLQAQPLLEEFKLSDMSISDKTTESLEANLQASDVPSLKSLQANPYVAMAFLRVAPRLESLNLMLASWDDTLLSRVEASSAAIKCSIRHFTIRVWYSSREDGWFWKNMTKVFLLFPNIEQLAVTVNSLTTQKKVKPAGYYFQMIAENAHVLPFLRNVDVQFEAFYPETPGIFEVEAQSLAVFRTACPLLETVVDPLRRVWTFRTDHQHPGRFAPQLSGRLIEEDLRRLKDLPAPEGSGS